MSERRRRGRRAIAVDPSDSPLHAFAHRIRARRQELNLTLVEVADDIRVGFTTLGDYERAVRPPPEEHIVRSMERVLDLPDRTLQESWQEAVRWDRRRRLARRWKALGVGDPNTGEAQERPVINGGQGQAARTRAALPVTLRATPTSGPIVAG